MRLEVISKKPDGNSRSTPLLFVHGAYHGAWCWENFLPFFANHGYEAHAVSLRGHGGSDGYEHIQSFRITDYIADMEEVAGKLSSPPVLIGHSMGGYVIQKYLERYAAPAAILLATVPVSGFMKMLVRTGMRHPWQALKLHVTRNMFALIEKPSLAREALFSADIPPETLHRHFMRLRNESYRVGQEGTFYDLPHPDKMIPIPMLIMGAVDDALFSCREIEETARTYNTRAEFFPNMAHDMMLEADWQKVAMRILEWLREQGL
ncbi:MAG TPA: alpha/beta fold hydrolase [Nitrospirota bacterium]|nr:alpha/beta fold hydrolase [Nitrospirota bacterium]